MDYALEVLVLPVTDVDRSLDSYRDKLGFALDVDYQPSHDFRVVQLTLPGSAYSIQIGIGLTDAAPGTVHRMHFVVRDIEKARVEWSARGVDVGEIQHKSPIDAWQRRLAPGPDAERRDDASLVEFADPDGNTWVIQEVGHRIPNATDSTFP